jgi:RimJ/RimL family protein N-acetyltransferase
MPKRPLGPLEGPRVRLRLLEQADLPLTLAWRNQDHIRRWFVHQAVITPDAHRRWFEAYADRDDDFVLMIEEIRGGLRPVGQAALYRIDWGRGRAEFGRLMIGEADAAGRGLAREATALLVEHALGPARARHRGARGVPRQWGRHRGLPGVRVRRHRRRRGAGGRPPPDGSRGRARAPVTVRRARRATAPLAPGIR